MDKTQLTTQSQLNYANIGEPISHELAAKMVKDFHDVHPDLPQTFIVGRKVLEQVLAQPGCVGMRFFNAINEEGQQTLVYAGIDETGNILFKYTVVCDDGKLNSVDALIGDRVIGVSWF